MNFLLSWAKNRELLATTSIDALFPTRGLKEFQCFILSFLPSFSFAVELLVDGQFFRILPFGFESNVLLFFAASPSQSALFVRVLFFPSFFAQWADELPLSTSLRSKNIYHTRSSRDFIGTSEDSVSRTIRHLSPSQTMRVPFSSSSWSLERYSMAFSNWGPQASKA